MLLLLASPTFNKSFLLKIFFDMFCKNKFCRKSHFLSELFLYLSLLLSLSFNLYLSVFFLPYLLCYSIEPLNTIFYAFVFNNLLRLCIRLFVLSLFFTSFSSPVSNPSYLVVMCQSVTRMQLFSS